MAEGKIEGVVASKTASCCSYALYSSVFLGWPDDFFQNHFIITSLVIGPGRWGNGVVVPTQVVYAIGAVNFYQTLVHKALDQGQHAHVLHLEIPPFGGGEQDQGHAPIPKNQHFALQIQRGGLPLSVFFLHEPFSDSQVSNLSGLLE
jgi:hypothetical protein